MQQPPERIDKYQILSVLGKGAMGVVYHAYDPVVKRDVAIKLLSAIGSEETELISRFEREARLAGSLRHTNIVTIYDLGHYEGRPYIAMEYIVGRDLQAIIKQKIELTFEQQVEIFLQIAKGLDAAHQKGIIHRDIKPANIRLQDDHTVKIMDFGIARMGTSELTRSGYIIGTLQYMSPEQISGEHLDPRTDIFSAGVIAYELFTRTNPFNGEHTVDIMYRILNVRPQPVQDIPDEFGHELNQIISRALEKNRDLRYPSAKDLAQDLEEYLFYIKSLKFRKKIATRVSVVQEGATQTLPVDQLPVAPERDPDVPPTVHSDMANMPTYHMPSPGLGGPQTGSQGSGGLQPPTGGLQSSSGGLRPPTGGLQPSSGVQAPTGVQPNTGVQPPTGIRPQDTQRAPRTGLGANYSETASVLMTRSAWVEKKFYILGVILFLAFIGGLFALVTFRAKPVMLAVITKPDGAQIYHDGNLVGKTPTTLTLEKENTTLILRKDGFKDKPVVLQKGSWPDMIHEPLEAVAPPATKKIRLTSEPAGATVFIDGKDSGNAPHEISLQEGETYRVAFKLEGYEPEERTINFSTEESITIPLKEIPPPPPVVGYVQYAGGHSVAIYKDGKALGSDRALEPGKHTVAIVSKKPWIRQSRTVEVVAGQTTTIPAVGLGSLTITASPSNCKIYLNKDYLDFPPILKYPVQAGTHTITFTWETPERKQKSQVVKVESGREESVRGILE